MGLFSRGKSKDRPDADAVDTDLTDDGLDRGDQDDVASAYDDADAPAGRDASTGPLDRSEVDDDSDYLNLGAIWLRGQQGMELRLEVNEQEQQITGVTAVLGESAVQLQAFAAPRTEGVWIDIRNEIAASIVDAGGTAEVLTGEFGEELLTRMPQADPEGRTVFMPARFVGVDGPRWFLRAVVSGRAAIEPAAAEGVHEVIRTAVIDRGEEAMPPRELLPLRLPDADGAAQADAGDGTDGGPDLNPFERGPEITEVR
ncbi:DUF3710 domain-containing protein [Terrabacter sp. C0L_2]|uniref:DUF3710 domain-containing protein n=1 Tax=Terrabacter sp. C0L_2 TaxID=3108389 RepID=UPI002ED277CF|nr:DUF3710 domain-containing protein [Terrabacter sp. C0L_2]